MSIHWEGMTKMGMNKGRGDAKGSKGGHALFGKSGGGSSTISNKLIASTMTPKMPGASKAASSGRKKGY